MTPTITMLQGDSLDELRKIPDGSIHCCVTSPPYWRQRDYHVAGQIGLEKTPEEYVERITAVFHEVLRVLKPDGTCWVNIGDKWASGGNGGGGSFMEQRGEAGAHAKHSKGWRNPPVGYKDKDLVGVPWMVAFSMRADGWYLRQCNIWAKPNCMPESVRDRSTASHEYVFQFSKSADYWYDAAAVRNPPSEAFIREIGEGYNGQATKLFEINGVQDASKVKSRIINGARERIDKQRGHSRRHNGFNNRWDALSVEEQRAAGSNLRSVWWISPAQSPDDHFAVMPDRLAAICIQAGCPPDGTVLDPFGGRGTTGKVAIELGRNSILIELNPEYAAMAEQSCNVTPGLPLV